MNKKMLDELNLQIQEELNSMYIYMAMGADLDEKGWGGMAHWMRRQAQEEFGHAMKIQGYIRDRLQKAVFQTLPAPQATWDSPKKIFEAAFAHEQHITGRIHHLVKLARELDDIATEVFLQWFVTEQVEEEEAAQSVVDMFDKIKDSAPGMFQLDAHLGKRD